MNAQLLLIGYQKASQTDVPRGENSGKALAHRNNVMSLATLGKWDGSPYSGTFIPPQSEGVAVLVQSIETGEVLGAAWR